MKTRRTIFNPTMNTRQNVFKFIEFLCGRELFLLEKIILEFQFNKEKIPDEINSGYDCMYVISKAWNKCK